jgi:hypothetical protein
MEEHEHYELQYWHNDEEIFTWATGIVPIIPRENESIFLVTDLPRRGSGAWWTVKEVVYQYHVSENTADLKQRILINLKPLEAKTKGVFKVD